MKKLSQNHTKCLILDKNFHIFFEKDIDNTHIKLYIDYTLTQ